MLGEHTAQAADGITLLFFTYSTFVYSKIGENWNKDLPVPVPAPPAVPYIFNSLTICCFISFVWHPAWGAPQKAALNVLPRRPRLSELMSFPSFLALSSNPSTPPQRTAPPGRGRSLCGVLAPVQENSILVGIDRQRLCFRPLAYRLRQRLCEMTRRATWPPSGAAPVGFLRELHAW